MKPISLMIKTIFFSFVFSIAGSCGGNSAEPSGYATDKTTTSDTTRSMIDSSRIEVGKEVRISPKQFKAINIQLNDLETKNLANVLKATGYLTVPPQNKASITSVLGGTVKSVFVQEGNLVRAGQTLATLINPEFVGMQQEYLDAQAQLNAAQANYARQQELSKENVNSKRTLQESEATYKSLLAKVKGLQSQIALLGIRSSNITAENMMSSFAVTTPITGTVAKVNINLGSTVEPSTPLFEVVDNSRLHLDLFIYEQDLSKVKIGQNVDFALTNLPGKNFTAKVYSIGSAFENETKTIPVHAVISGHKGELIEGMNVTGLIDLGDNTTTAVLSNAIASYNGVDYIFYQKQDSANAIKNPDEGIVFQRARVKKGITSGNYTEVTPLEPIPQKAKVVTNGAFYLMAILTNTGEDE